MTTSRKATEELRRTELICLRQLDCVIYFRRLIVGYARVCVEADYYLIYMNTTRFVVSSILLIIPAVISRVIG